MRGRALLVGTAVLASVLCACSDRRGDSDAVADVLRATSGAQSVGVRDQDGNFTQRGSVNFTVTLTPGTSDGDIGVIAKKAVDGLRHNSLNDLSGSFTLLKHNGARMDTTALVASTPAAAVAATARAWARLAEAYPDTRLTVTGGRLIDAVDLSAEVGTGWPVDPSALVAVFSAIEAAGFPPNSGTTWRVGAAATDEGKRHSARWASRTGPGVAGPPPAVQQLMVALQKVVNKPNDVKLEMAWRVDYSGREGLDVRADLATVEFRTTPGNQINPKIAGSAAERAGNEYVHLLEASGVPFTLTVEVYANGPFLEAASR